MCHITVHIIFNENFDRQIAVRVTGEDSLEYGSVIRSIKGTRDEARHVDSVFDKRTSIANKGNLLFE
ncbi:MAG: hypothetical protein J0I84_17390 [Terrimonas sp.]|nr:hypothetical protein [Terrimonas sp.]OJY95782.1 MAG: hypothetical protein BGP13_00330 [Sphingobacteriales bacterium 40-81]